MGLKVGYEVLYKLQFVVYQQLATLEEISYMLRTCMKGRLEFTKRMVCEARAIPFQIGEDWQTRSVL